MKIDENINWLYIGYCRIDFHPSNLLVIVENAAGAEMYSQTKAITNNRFVAYHTESRRSMIKWKPMCAHTGAMHTHDKGLPVT